MAKYTVNPTFRLTTKQIEIMTVVIFGNRKDANRTDCDLDQLRERLSYLPSKESLHFSIRKLAKKGMLIKAGYENRRERNHVIIAPTKLALDIFQTKENTSFIEPIEDFVI